jgi:Arc/MetJ family transcription regulator
MRTTIVLDEKLVGEAMQLASVKTRREMVDRALREYVSRHRQQRILQLANQGLISADYNIRAVRKGACKDSG